MGKQPLVWKNIVPSTKKKLHCMERCTGCLDIDVTKMKNVLKHHASKQVNKPLSPTFKVWQYITLMRRIYLVDCPGVVYPTGSTPTECVLKNVVSVFRNVFITNIYHSDKNFRLTFYCSTTVRPVYRPCIERRPAIWDHFGDFPWVVSEYRLCCISRLQNYRLVQIEFICWLLF